MSLKDVDSLHALHEWVIASEWRYGAPSFAQWAFGDEGFSNLEILAIGDLACHWHPSRSMLLARDSQRCNGLNFKIIEEADLEEETTVKDAIDFLKACPKDAMLARKGHRYRFPG